MTAALIPVKSLELGKSRLRALLPAEAIPALSLAMLEDVISALEATTSIECIAVITPDPAVGTAAQALGAIPLVRDDPGLDPSVEMASRELAQKGHCETLVVMGDVPGVTPEAIASVLSQREALGPQAVVVAASQDGGTTALLRAPWNVIPTAYGPDSAARHYDLAKHAGIPVRILHHPDLSLDLDQPEDLRSFHEQCGGGRKTRAILRELGVFDSLERERVDP